MLDNLGRIQLDQEKIYTNDIMRRKVFPGYKKYIEKDGFTIYRGGMIRPLIVAAFSSVVVTKRMKSDSITIYPDYRNRLIYYRVSLTPRVFPGLLKDSHIAKVFVIPFLREIEKDKYSKRWRVVIITNKCQIYHNFPKRDALIDGHERYGDIKRFEESAIWDIPERKYPSKIKECDESEIWFPCLPEECYDYHPAVNEHSKYGNLGFEKFTYVSYKNKRCKVSRFYFPNRGILSNPFIYMGGLEIDYKMTLIGTYQANKSVGARTAVFASSDGGRNWYAKIEFGDEGEYEFRQGSDDWGRNSGNKLVFNNSFAGEIQVVKRCLKHNGTSLFEWERPIDVKDINTENGLLIICKGEHNFSTGNIVAFRTEGYISKEWEWLLNNRISQYSAGNGVVFKVEVRDKESFYIRENVMNPFTNIACRHIHHINRVRDGWIIGTGEIYPNGWLIYAQMLESDTYSIFPASSEFALHILNHSSKSVQRTLGADIIEDNEPLLVFASDHDTLERYVKVGDYQLRRNSVGIYKGLLKDIDDFSKFSILYEAKEPAYFFKKLDNHYVFSGQRGEFVINIGDEWIAGRTDEPMVHYLGATCQFHVLDKYLIVFNK